MPPGSPGLVVPAPGFLKPPGQSPEQFMEKAAERPFLSAINFLPPGGGTTTLRCGVVRPGVDIIKGQ
jgi:hypothetical protein